jgi:membrane protein
MLRAWRLVRNVARRFGAEHYAQTAAALSFATLLGLVPMVVVGAALLEWLPFGVKLSAALERFLLDTLLPEKAGQVIAKHLAAFAQRAERVTWIGLAFLTMTALMQMLTIERSFAAIWKVKKPRPLVKRVGLHLLTLLLGPLAFGSALASTTYLATVSFGWVAEARWMRLLFSEALPPFFLALLFGLLYWALPNRAVSRWHAAFSGILTALAFVGMQRLFALYIVKLPTYALIYGAFAALPIFLLWLYLSWTVILIGALITAELPHSA